MRPPRASVVTLTLVSHPSRAQCGGSPLPARGERSTREARRGPLRESELLRIVERPPCMLILPIHLVRQFGDSLQSGWAPGTTAGVPGASGWDRYSPLGESPVGELGPSAPRLLS